MGWVGEETIAISDEERMEAEAAAVVSCVMNVSVAAASRPCLPCRFQSEEEETSSPPQQRGSQRGPSSSFARSLCSLALHHFRLRCFRLAGGHRRRVTALQATENLRVRGRRRRRVLSGSLRSDRERRRPQFVRLPEKLDRRTHSVERNELGSRRERERERPIARGAPLTSTAASICKWPRWERAGGNGRRGGGGERERGRIGVEFNHSIQFQTS